MVTAAWVAERFGVAEVTVHGWVRNQDLPARMVAGRRWFDRNEVEEWAERRSTDHQLTCARCGAAFMAARAEALYCSSTCKQAAYRKRRKARNPDADSFRISETAVPCPGLN